MQSGWYNRAQNFQDFKTAQLGQKIRDALKSFVGGVASGYGGGGAPPPERFRALPFVKNAPKFTTGKDVVIFIRVSILPQLIGLETHLKNSKKTIHNAKLRNSNVLLKNLQDIIQEIQQVRQDLDSIDSYSHACDAIGICDNALNFFYYLDTKFTNLQIQVDNLRNADNYRTEIPIDTPYSKSIFDFYAKNTGVNQSLIALWNASKC